MPRQSRARPETWKKPNGISLTREQWERIDAIADSRGVEVSRSEVVSDAVSLYLSAIAGSANTAPKAGKSAPAEDQSVPDDAPLGE